MGKRKLASREKLDPRAVTWCDTSLPAVTFLKQFQLPQLVKLNSGEYGNFGCGTDVDVSQPFLLHTARNCIKVC